MGFQDIQTLHRKHGTTIANFAWAIILIAWYCWINNSIPSVLYALNWTKSCETDVNVFTAAEADLAALKELLMVLALEVLD